MKRQTKRSILPAKKIGKRVPCGPCGGSGVESTEGRDEYGNSYPIITGHACPRCKGRGTVLFPLKFYVERLVA